MFNLENLCKGAKKASTYLKTIDTKTKNEALLKIADALTKNTALILSENQKDIEKLSSLRNDNFIINKDRKFFCIDGDWSVTEKELLGIVQDIARILKYKCIIVADTWNIDVDPYKFCIYSFGSEVKYRNFEVK